MCDSKNTQNVGIKFLVFGSKGWIGNMFMKLLSEKQISTFEATTRPGKDLDEKVEAEIDEVNPTHIVSLLGRTHGPTGECSTIDYLEGGLDKTVINLQDNLYAPTLLGLLCHKKGIHLTYLATGCIFTYDEEHPITSGIGFKEEDRANFFGSSYSVVKGFTDRIMTHLKDVVLNVRIRMPISSQVHYRNFITKITNYNKVVNIPNSVTCLDELLPIMLDMSIRKMTGCINLVNPKAISHNEVLSMYKEIVDPDFEIRNFSLEEQSTILKAGRSNCELSTDKLCSLYHVDDSKTAVRKCLEKMARQSK